MKILSLDEYKELKSMQSIKVNLTFKGDNYSCKFNSLSYDVARLWLEKNTKQIVGVDKFNTIKRWVDLTEKYKYTISFYPKVETPYLENYIHSSGILELNTELDYKDKLINYWLNRSNLNPLSLNLQQILDIGRVANTLHLYTLNYIEFTNVLDVEILNGYSKEYSEKFYLLFNYCRLINKNKWVYSDRELKLIESVLTSWKTWLLVNNVDVHKLIDLTVKYLGIVIPTIFIDILWGNKTYELTLLPFYYKNTFEVDEDECGACNELIKSLQLDSLNLLGITIKDTFVEARQKYHALIKEVHPDFSITPNEVKTKELNLAWEIFKNYYAQTN
jgi:hypothetical protein